MIKLSDYEDLTGKTFNGWTFVKPVGNGYWECKCKCGTIKNVYRTSITSNKSTSCGCERSAKLSSRNSDNKTHGMTNTRFYTIWANMKRRCNNPNDKDFNNYGGKGIKVCDRWLTFSCFMEDMYDSYVTHSELNGELNTTIERLNVSDGYNIDNCRWATKEEQNNNTSKTIMWTHNGKTQTITDWSRETGINRQTLYNRVYCNGWKISDALEMPTMTEYSNSKSKI